MEIQRKSKSCLSYSVSPVSGSSWHMVDADDGSEVGYVTTEIKKSI